MIDATEIMVILDKSGSMLGKTQDVIGGFNKMVEEQRKNNKPINLSLVLFDTDYGIIHNRIDIKDVPLLTDKNYSPHGNTALNDAVARGITELGNQLEKIPESNRPNKVICVIITDGEENSSKYYSKNQIKEMIKHQSEVYNWKFLYFGANVDAFLEANSLGIDSQNAVNFTADSKGIARTYAMASNYISHYAVMGTIKDNWKDESEE